MRIKRVFALTLSALMAGSILAGCSNDKANSDSGSAQTAATTTAAQITEAPGNGNIDGKGATLKVLTHRTDRVEDGTLQKLTKAFEEKYNCKVEYQGFTDYESDVSTMLTTKNYGDVLMVPTSVKLSDLGNFFEPLGAYDELDKEWMWAETRMSNNTVYGISMGGTASGILYNTKVWKEAGITTLPKTPQEFIECLKKIKAQTSAIPYYTQYADASWTITQWQSLVVSASGDPNYENRIMENKEDLFKEGEGYYTVYKMLFDIFSDPTLTEEDHATTDWEGSKPAFAEGKIATVVLGSWAISQFQAFAEDPNDIGFMPFPNTVNGKVWAQTASDYCLGVNKNSSNIELGKAYINWFCGDSGFAMNEGMISPKKGAALPENLSAFAGAEMFSATVAPEELTGKFNEIDMDSEVGTWQGDSNNFKIQLAEAAFAGKGEAAMKAIFEDANKRFSTSRDKILADYYKSK